MAYSRFFRLGLCAAIVSATSALLFALARKPEGPVPFPVEAGHPYAKAFSIYETLSTEEREALVSTKEGKLLSPDLVDARKAISGALAAGRDVAPAWRVVHDHLLPGFDEDFSQTLSSLASVSLSDAHIMSDAGPGACDAAVLDGLGLYLSAGRGLTLERWGQQQDFIVGALRRLRERASALTPVEAAAMLLELRALPPLVSFADMVRDDPTWKAPGTRLRHKLERRARALGLTSNTIDPAVLRMAGFTVEADRASVSFETPAGAFWLAPGQDRYGVSLVELDIEGRQARIRFEGRDATVELKSRQIEQWDDQVLEGAIDSVCSNLGFIEILSLESLLKDRPKDVSLSEHLEWVDNLGLEIQANYREIAEGRLNESPDVEALEKKVKKDDPYGPEWVSAYTAFFTSVGLRGRATGEKTASEWQMTIEVLERVSGTNGAPKDSGKSLEKTGGH